LHIYHNRSITHAFDYTQKKTKLIQSYIVRAGPRRQWLSHLVASRELEQSESKQIQRAQLGVQVNRVLFVRDQFSVRLVGYFKLDLTKRLFIFK
jgi:hypothetical protein